MLTHSVLVVAMRPWPFLSFHCYYTWSRPVSISFSYDAESIGDDIPGGETGFSSLRVYALLSCNLTAALATFALGIIPMCVDAVSLSVIYVLTIALIHLGSIFPQQLCLVM